MRILLCPGSSGLASGSRSYTYDRDSNRLTKVEGGSTFTYGYDRTGELLTVLKTGGTTQNFGYDAFGNMTADAQTGLGVTTMTYDLDDHLTAIDAAGTSNDATFTIDALGRFRTRVIGATTDTYSYLDTSETVTRVASGGTTTDSIVSPAGDRLGVRVGSTVNWFLPDLHGSVAGSLDAAETTVVNAIRYDAWGQTIQTGTAGGTRVGDKAWKYQGRLDVSPELLDTALYDMSARFYSPGVGAFTQLDSVMGSAQDPLSMNRFLYAHANPATLIDPTGHYVEAGEKAWHQAHHQAARKQTVRRQTVRRQTVSGHHEDRKYGNAGPARRPSQRAKVYTVEETLGINVDTSRPSSSYGGARYGAGDNLVRTQSNEDDDASQFLIMGIQTKMGPSVPYLGPCPGQDPTACKTAADALGAGSEMTALKGLASAGKGVVTAAKAGSQAAKSGNVVASALDLIKMMDKRPGVTAYVARGDELRYLKHQKAYASTMHTAEGFEVRFRPRPTRAQVIHEWMHVVRTRQGRGFTAGEEAWIDNWIERHARMLRLEE